MSLHGLQEPAALTGCDPCCRIRRDDDVMDGNAMASKHLAAAPGQECTLASIAGVRVDQVIERFAWLRGGPSGWASHWETPVAVLESLRAQRIWALARTAAEPPTGWPNTLFLDECDVLFGCGERDPHKPMLMNLADLSSRLAAWSGIRVAYWHQLAQRSQASLRDRQAFIQWIAPVERRLRDEVILQIWRQALQGEILPSPVFATGHAMTLPLVRWVLAPRQEALRLQRRAVIGRARAVIGLLLGQMTNSRSEVFGALRCLARLFRDGRQPSSRAIAKALAPRLYLPPWAVRRIMQFEVTGDETDAGTSLTDLQRLSRKRPPKSPLYFAAYLLNPTKDPLT